MSNNRRLFGRTGVLLLSALIWALPMMAQLNTSKVEGTVKDADTGQPLQGAQVVIEGTRLGNVTNADGYYFILNVPPGRRDITFTYTGYQKVTIADQLLLSGQTTTVNANMSSTVVQLEGITVEGQSEVLMPRDNTVSKQRMTSEKIAETPATTLEDMLILEAGVQTGGPDALGRGLRIRGGRLGEEAMVIDGVTVRNYTADPFRNGWGWVYDQEVGSLSEDASPLEFSAGAVEQVDIITGGFQAEYGNAQSGVVNIVTKEGGQDWHGNARFTSDGANPRTADYGYNQLTVSLGGPISPIPNLYIHASGELQGLADRQPRHGDEGFHGVNQDFVDHLNDAVRNDPVFGSQEPVFSLEQLQAGHEFYVGKMGGNASLFEPGNPVRIPGNWGDRTLASSKLTYYPIQGLKLIGSINFSRNQHAYATGDNGDYFKTGIVTISTLPERDWAKNAPDTMTVIPQEYARRTRTTNLLLGGDWDFYRSANRSGSLQFRYTRFKTQDINSSSIKDGYVRSENTTFGGWSMHDVPFEVETRTDPRAIPIDGQAGAFEFYPDGYGAWHRFWDITYPFRLIQSDWLYWLAYYYTREWQNNYKADLDFQINRTNRAKIGFQFADFSNDKFDFTSQDHERDLNNEFNYAPYILGAYVQNRTDLGDFVFNYGLRYDRFDPVDNWGFKYGDDWGERFFANSISEWSPRFDVGFPVTDKSQLRFSYGVFKQLPSFSYIFSGNNPGGLEYSRTDAFEAGMSYLLSDDMVVDVVGYYRDVLGNVSSKQFFRDYYQWHEERRVRSFQTGFTNRDSGNIKGMDFTMRKRFSNNFAYSFVYTLQFSRTTGSDYASTAGFSGFLDPSTGATYIPPDELRPINGDVTHKMTVNVNYLFPQDFKSGTIMNPIFKDLRVFALWQLQSGAPVDNRVEDLSWMSDREGRVIGGLNYFRSRWDYKLDLRLNKQFRMGRAYRISFFGEIFNLLNKKLTYAYPAGLSYESYYRTANGGLPLVWDDGLSLQKKVWFNADFNQDGVLSLQEQAMGNIAHSVMMSTMDKKNWGSARQIRLGAEFTF